MTSIIKANENDSALLSGLAKTTFIESHGNSARPEDIYSYVSDKYSDAIFKKELSDSTNQYHILYHDKTPVGYSNLILDCPFIGSPLKNFAKMERLYLLKEFYNLKLGRALFQFNIALSKTNNQLGIWLYVWKDNTRAINFYKKNGFNIIGSHDFKISDTHSNPNHQMFLKF